MGTTRPSEPSAVLLLQRVRNRIIEYLELVSSFEKQREYQLRVQIEVVPEIVNQWEDWVVNDWASTYVDPVFSEYERLEIARFERAWSEVADRLPEPLPSLEEAQCTSSWSSLRAAAERALQVFERRGRLPEDDDEAGDVT